MATQPQFDLDILLKINYEYEPLKKLLEYLLKRDKESIDQSAKLTSSVEENHKEFKMYVRNYHTDY